MIYEVFDTAEAVDDHRKTAHYKATTEKLESLMTAPRAKDYFRLVMAKGRDQVA